jgi:L-asparagine transporter-like permease
LNDLPTAGGNLDYNGSLVRFCYTSLVQTADDEGREHGLHRELTAGQMAMVAVGGSIGTGLLLGSAAAIEVAGPAVILSFLFAAFVTWTVTLALGELASVHPAAGSFQLWGERYLGEWAGFLSGAGYWAAIAISIGAEMVAAATYMAFWFPGVAAVVWVAVASVLLLGVNLLSVGRYGRFEYWFAMIKVVVILAFVVLGAALMLGGGTPPQYTAHGGLFPKGALATLFALPFALYTFSGVEFVAVASGESRSTEHVARATHLTFAILAIVYLGAIVVLTGVMPWNRAGVHESPFVTVFRTVRVPGAATLMNFVVLTAALSGANAALYAASRTLFALARYGWAPQVLGRLNRAGSPTFALITSSFSIVLALALERWAPQQAFVSILNAALFGLLLSWLVSLASHIRFRQAARESDLSRLPRRSPLGAAGSAIGFTLIVLAILRTWWDSRLSFASGAVYLLVLNAAYLLLRSTRPRQPGV